MRPLRIGFLGFDGVMALDLIAPIDAFTLAGVDETVTGLDSLYETVIVGLTDRPFQTESGVIFLPNKTIANITQLDTLFIPGGRGLRDPDTQKRAAQWIQERAGEIRRIAAVRTGTYALAASGLLKGRSVTTHWRHAHELAHRFPELQVDDNALFLQDGKFYTCAGTTAGIDLSLALIEEDFGPRTALSVAKELVLYSKRNGGDQQFSESLRFQTQAHDKFGDLAAWIKGHLRSDLTTEALAARANLSPRHFSRRFKAIFGTTPANFVENLRLREACDRLTLPDQTIDSVSYSVGFRSADAFRRAFERCYGLQPSCYQKRYSAHQLNSPMASNRVKNMLDTNVSRDLQLAIP